MTPEEARQRAEEILRRQDKGTQIIELNSDGTLKMHGAPVPQKKSTVLHDPHGEYT